MKSTDPLEESYVRELHHRMFDNVWKWAGTYRKHELNIGCDSREIPQRVPQLLGNVQYWLELKTFPVDESLVRFHHQLVSKIHPFPNGNGRHARMITDVVAVKLGYPDFTLGCRKTSRRGRRCPHQLSRRAPRARRERKRREAPSILCPLIAPPKSADTIRL